MSNPMFQMSADARLLYQRLTKVGVGEEISYDVLASEISRPVSGATTALQTAVRNARKNDDMVFAAIRGVGLKRLEDAEIIASATQGTVSIRRRARKEAEKLTKIRDYGALPQAKQIEHTARLSIFGAIAEMANEKSVKKIEAIAGNRAGELPIAQTLAAFGR